MVHANDGTIYFIQRGVDGPIKIGFTQNLDKRLAQLQSVSPYLLEIVRTERGGPKEEQYLHRKFKHLRISTSEWFEPGPELLAYLGRSKPITTTIAKSGEWLVIVRNKIKPQPNSAWYWVEGRVLIQYGRKLGPNGLAVYNVLLYLTTQGGTWSLQAIADVIGLSEEEVAKEIDKMCDLGLMKTDYSPSLYVQREEVA